jgi:hypothetical protein
MMSYGFGPKMLNDFSTEYSELTDDEILHLSSERHSLTPDAVVALDAELRRRNLSESDRVEHQRFVRRQERHEFKGRRRRKVFGKRQFSWRELLSAFGVMGGIMWAYFALPKQYHLKADWEEPALCVMICSVLVIVGWRSLWRDILFWLALILSAVIQLAIVHTWVRRAGELSRGGGRLGAFLGFVLFLAIYGCFTLLRRNFYGERSSETQ